MLLAVGVISTGVFILSSGHWEQVQSLLKALAPRDTVPRWFICGGSSTATGLHWEGTPLSFSTKHVGFWQSCVLALVSV